MVKTRSTDTTIPFHGVYTSKINGQIWAEYSGSEVLPTMNEFIRYTNGAGENACYHAKTISTYNSGGFSSSDGSWNFAGSGPSTYFSQPSWRYTPLPPGLSSLDNIVQGWFDSLPASAYADMAPSMETGFSLPNFILELGDFRSLFSIWNRSQTTIHNLANGNLNYQFGWKPFIGDLKKLMKGMIDFEARLENLVSRQMREQRRHWKNTPTATLSGSVIDYYTLRVTTTYEVTMTKYCATMSYIYDLPKYSARELKIRGILDTLGMDLSPTVLWEAIPFSWLADWFFNVQNCLTNPKWISPNISLRQFIHSGKITVLTKIQGQYVPSVSPGYFPMAEHTTTLYHRSVGAPGTLKPGLNTDLSSRQIGILASLYLARR